MKRQTDTQRNEERDKQADKKKTVTQSAKLTLYGPNFFSSFFGT